MTDAARQLLILRHAKAEPFARTDHERALTPRGQSDAAAVGRWLAQEALAPDYVVVSSAARTQETWQAVHRASGCAPVVTTDRSLYGAGTDAALEIIRSAPQDARSLMLVGHNPTMAYLVHLLDDGGADTETFIAVSAGYPTSALTVLSVATTWVDLDVASARIDRFFVGRA